MGDATSAAAVDGLSAAQRALLERRLRGELGAHDRHIQPRAPGATPPLSFGQERLWFMEQFAPGTGAYGAPLAIWLGAAVDPAALASALGQVCRRHESLRMRFPATDGRPTVVIDPPGQVALPRYDVPDEARARTMLVELARRPFDLANGPLVRAAVLRVGGGAEHILLLDLHHIVTDGWSNDIIVAELDAHYRAGGRPVSELATPVQYGDFAAWQRTRMDAAQMREHVRHWRARLAGVPALELPLDLPRPPAQTFAGAWHRFRLEPDLVAALERLARQCRATLFMVLLAAYQATLSRYSGQIDFAIGTPVAGRAHPELDRVVGMFVNMLPLRIDLSGEPTGTEAVTRTRHGVLDALAHQDVPFDKLVSDMNLARDVSRAALFQAMFVLQNYGLRGAGDPAAGTALAWRPVELPATRFDLEWHAYATADGGLACRLVYNTALWRADSIARLGTALSTLLTALAHQPDTRLIDLDLRSAPERARMRRWNATAVASRPATLPELFAHQVRRTPHAVAVIDDDTTLSYAELDRAANRLARRLRRRGVEVESVVAVCAQRSAQLVVALLAVVKAGGAYLPLDPDYPPARLELMLDDSCASLVLTQRPLAGRLPVAGVPRLYLDLDAGRAGAADEPTAPDIALPDIRTPDIRIPVDAAAYLIYTSGSTGRPKGVVNTHRGIVNRLDWMQQRFQLSGADVVLQKTPASFDVSVWEFFWPLIVGARLVLARPGGHRDPAYLRQVIQAHRVSTLHFVPSMLAAFLADAPEACPSLRTIVCSGEELPRELARRTRQWAPTARLDNLYGPTEAAVDVTAWECTDAGLSTVARVPIGAPMANVRVHVLDTGLAEVGVGAVGELYLGGVQVARGYHARAALTAQRFIPDPYGPPGARLYATGDLARWRDDGTVEFLGRADGQVKLRGQRIELGEIEAALRALPGIRDAAAAVKPGPAGDERIVGYVVAPAWSPDAGPPTVLSPDAVPLDPASLRTALLRVLPQYMVPSTYVALAHLPLSPSGKLDRAALPAAPAPVGAGPRAAPANATELAVAQIWQVVLGIGPVGLDDDFFDLGGHSLLATQVVARLRSLTDRTGRRVGVMDLFQHPTVRALARLIDGEDGSGGGPAPRRLLYRLTPPVADPICSYVCVPYGGGSAAVYQPLADALPAGHCLYSVAIPGHDVGLDEMALPFDELAARCAAEVLERVPGPLVLYGHCGVGGALIIELARRLEAAGRPITAIYVGGVFPFARPRGPLARLQSRLAELASNRHHANWLRSMGVDISDVGPDQADRIIANMRRDSAAAEQRFSDLFATQPDRLRAPIISVVGERDPITDYYQERYREWCVLSDTAAVVLLDEAGHFFVRHRAAELAGIVTTTHARLASDVASCGVDGPSSSRVPAAGPRWRLLEVSRVDQQPAPSLEGGPSMRRFAAVAVSQLVSVSGSALTAWAIPVWLYLTTGSLTWLGLSGVFAILPVLIATPLAGAVADRADRRRVIMAASAAAAAVELSFAAALWAGRASLPLIYLVVWLVAAATTFQRIAFTAAIPQLVPKRFLGHANGIAQLTNGIALLFAPVLAAGLLATIDLAGILVLDIASYAVALGVLAAVRFPRLMGRRRRERFRDELLGGLRLCLGSRPMRAMLIFFGVTNLFYAVPVMLLPPLVLGYAGMGEVGQVALAEGLGFALGGLVMTVWGGPRTGRMAANIWAIAAAGAFVALTGLRANMIVVALGACGTAAALALANGIYLTVIQVKVPQRFHARVIALNQTLTWCTLPIGLALLVPAAGALEPLMRPGGALAGTAGAVLGTGPGRGIGLAFVLCGLSMVIVAVTALLVRDLARLDHRLPDALADDLVGLRALADTRASRQALAAHTSPPRVRSRARSG